MPKPIKKLTLMARLAMAAESFRQNAWWNYLNHICNGRRAPSQEAVSFPPNPPGTQLQATDRVYEVTSSGAWRKVAECDSEVPAHKSQIRMLPKPDRNKYNKFTLAVPVRPETKEADTSATTPEAASA
jgi:hypothetical protein